jgi:phosphatidylglycerol:prolipoprotein diacylglycerol transferase
MHPIILELGDFTVYAYGLCIGIGIVLAAGYAARQGKKEFGLTIDHVNNLLLLMLLAGYVGGKAFLLFENPEYLRSPAQLFSGSGFVFYGSFLFCIPVLLWYLRRNSLPIWPMLDLVAIATCIVHGFGRIGCFMAGCCYGIPVDAGWGVIFTNPVCQASPLNTPLFPTQAVEAAFIFVLFFVLLWLRGRRQFEGQLFLLYAIVYAIGRALLEFLRGDLDRGFLFQQAISTSQFIAVIIALAAVYFYRIRRNANLLNRPK